MRTKSQRLADLYAGSHQILVSIYKDEAVVYAQVSEHTAKGIMMALIGSRNLVLREKPGMSEDGLTWCFLVLRSKGHPGAGDWLPVAMTSLFMVLQLTAAHVLDVEGSVTYTDCRQLDLTTVDSFLEAVTPRK